MPSLVESIISLDVGAQEPWPNDVKLFQPYAMEQILLPDNANCLAVQAFLHMCGLPFQIEHRANAEFMSPSGKVPFIKCGAFVVSELEPIVQFVANKGITLTDDLSTEQKSDMRAYMSIIHTVLVNAELYICWCDKRTYNEVTKPRNGSVYPWPLNHCQTWSKKSAIIKKLKLLGWYQKTIENVYEEVENCCQALSERLEGKEYFFGSKPTQVDALLYGHFVAILCTPNCCDLFKNIINNFTNLVSHCKRVHARFVSSFVSDLKQLTHVSNEQSILDDTSNKSSQLLIESNNTQSQEDTKNSSSNSDSTMNDVQNIESNEEFVANRLSQIFYINGKLCRNYEDITQNDLTGVSASQMLNCNDIFILSNVSSQSDNGNSVTRDDRSETSEDLAKNSGITEISLILNDENCFKENTNEVISNDRGETSENLQGNSRKAEGSLILDGEKSVQEIGKEVKVIFGEKNENEIEFDVKE